MKDKFNNQFATQKLRNEEGSASDGVGAYLPGLDVPEKKYKGPEESEVHDGYKKVKGFRAGHTKDTGGLQYEDLWNVNEEQDEEQDFEEGDEAKVVDKDDFKRGKIGTVIRVESGVYTLEFKDGSFNYYQKNQLQAPASSNEPKGPQKTLTLEENYSRFRNETKTRTNEQQFHTAVKLAEKKIKEANRILEYTAQLKSELSVIKENKNTQKIMERITRGIAEAYSKMKKLK